VSFVVKGFGVPKPEGETAWRGRGSAGKRKKTDEPPKGGVIIEPRP